MGVALNHQIFFGIFHQIKPSSYGGAPMLTENYNPIKRGWNIFEPSGVSLAWQNHQTK